MKRVMMAAVLAVAAGCGGAPFTMDGSDPPPVTEAGTGVQDVVQPDPPDSAAADADSGRPPRLGDERDAASHDEGQDAAPSASEADLPDVAVETPEAAADAGLDAADSGGPCSPYPTWTATCATKVDVPEPLLCQTNDPPSPKCVFGLSIGQDSVYCCPEGG